MSMCRADIQYSLCSYSYDDVLLTVNKYIPLERAGILKMAEVLGVELGDASSDKEKPIELPVFHGPGCVLKPLEMACK